jgi:glycosyltransferase involved in cell wall biosynthesis
MRILFICGSLEPGRDGVGDYTIRLSVELIKSGNQVALVALNDPFITGFITGRHQVEHLSIETLRISSTVPDKARYNRVQNFINTFKPDWISLQFVPYSFNDKGIPFGLAQNLPFVGGKSKWHIMYHELWIGINTRLSFKNNVVKRIQRFIIHNLNSKLQPACITTSIPSYFHEIEAYKPKILPLFGNIQISDRTDRVHRHGLNEMYVIHFGSFSGQLNELRSQLQFIQSLSLLSSKPVKFFVLGDSGMFKDQALLIAQETFGDSAVVFIGRLKEHEVSQYMLQADIGISRANFSMYGKSGSTIAMLEHGLPVVLRGSQPAKELLLTDKYFCKKQLFFSDSTYDQLPLRQQPNTNSASDIATLFLSYLGNT